MKSLVIRGVPRGLDRDGWWLNAAADTNRGAAAMPAEPSGTAGLNGGLFLATLGLVALADYLFWGVEAGLSLTAFALAVILSALLVKRVTAKQAVAPIAIVILSCLPVVEEVQLLSRLFYWAGFLLAASWIALGGGKGIAGLLHGAARFLWLGLWQIGVDLHATRDALADRKGFSAKALVLLQSWTLPIVLGGIFILLFAAANPIAEDLLAAINLDWLFRFLAVDRLAFWLFMAAIIWPFLRIGKMALRMTSAFWRPARPFPRAPSRGYVVNAGSIGNSLALFNAIFAVQTLMDIGYLWGGFALPEGMTYAGYAHRGAYPLVATALLAGLFALISCSHARRGWMRKLLYLFLAQNLLLVASSALRLELYIEAYGLTYLRISAAIWMGLVAVGLATIIWQMARARSTLWLLSVNASLLALVLYSAAFVNWAGVIARHNLDPRFEGQIDTYYLCGLSEGAYPTVLEWEKRTGQRIYPSPTYAARPEFVDWREWGFRSWRVQRYFDQAQVEVAP